MTSPYSQRQFAQKLVDDGVPMPFLVVDKPIFPIDLHQYDESLIQDWKSEFNHNMALMDGVIIGTLAYTYDNLQQETGIFSGVQLIRESSGAQRPVFRWSNDAWIRTSLWDLWESNPDGYTALSGDINDIWMTYIRAAWNNC